MIVIDPSWIYGPIILVFVYFTFFYKSRKARLLEAFPKPEQFHSPILGIIPFFIKCPRNEILERMCSWNEICNSPEVRLYSPFVTALIATGRGTVEKLFNSQTNITKGFDYDYVRPWLGDGLLMSTGAKWGHRRKMLTPAFHFKILEDFMQVFNSEAQKMVKIVGKECKDGKTFDVCHYVTRCALDIICETAMGISINAQEKPDSDYIKAINEFGCLLQYRAFRPWLRFEILWKLSSFYKKQAKVLKTLHGFTDHVIKERKAEFLEEKKALKSSRNEKKEETENVYFKTKKRLAFLDLLLEVQYEKGESELSDLDIREETDTFMFEGHDTTSANIGFTFYALGCYPEIQAKVHEELDAIFGDDRERPVTSEDLTRMKYLECVIKEALRLYPSVPFIQRELSTDIVLDDGKIMPEGATVGIFIYKMHRDPSIFPEPMKFRPDRFSNTNHDPYAYVPFSAGPRNCIGQKFAMMEEKVMISSFLRSFSIKSMTKPEDLKLLSEMILRAENGLDIQVKMR